MYFCRILTDTTALHTGTFELVSEREKKVMHELAAIIVWLCANMCVPFII
jgi:hypothetical protein